MKRFKMVDPTGFQRQRHFTLFIEAFGPYFPGNRNPYPLFIIKAPEVSLRFIPSAMVFGDQAAARAMAIALVTIGFPVFRATQTDLARAMKYE
jgi:hypothetical protein